MRWEKWMAVIGGMAAGYGGVRWLQAVDREIGRNLVVPLRPGIEAGRAGRNASGGADLSLQTRIPPWQILAETEAVKADGWRWNEKRPADFRRPFSRGSVISGGASYRILRGR